MCAHYENRGIGCSGLNVEQPGKQVVEFPLTIGEAIDQLEGRKDGGGRREGAGGRGQEGGRGSGLCQGVGDGKII